MVNVVCGIRSTGRICTDLAEELERQGHEVKIAYGRESVPAQYQKYAIRIGADASVRMDALKSRLFDNAGFNSRRQTEKFLTWVRQYDPDLIHLHNLHGYYINLEVLFRYLRNEFSQNPQHRILWTLHDCWAFTGHSALCDGAGMQWATRDKKYFSVNQSVIQSVIQSQSAIAAEKSMPGDEENKNSAREYGSCTRWISGCHHCPQRREYPKAFIDRSSRNWRRKKRILQGIPNLTIVTPSHWLEGWAKESFLKEYPTKVIPNGIDSSVFHPADPEKVESFRREKGLAGKRVYLAAATTWTDLKGFQDYIRLAGLLDDDSRIVMIGGKSDRQRRKIQGTSGRIMDIDRTSDTAEMALWYNLADAYVNLTYCDTYPTVNVEAAACGTPVITYDTGGCREAMHGFGLAENRGELKKILRDIKTDIFAQHLDPPVFSNIDNSASLKEYMQLYGAGS